MITDEEQRLLDELVDTQTTTEVLPNDDDDHNDDVFQQQLRLKGLVELLESQEALPNDRLLYMNGYHGYEELRNLLNATIDNISSQYDQEKILHPIYRTSLLAAQDAVQRTTRILNRFIAVRMLRIMNSPVSAHKDLEAVSVQDPVNILEKEFAKCVYELQNEFYIYEPKDKFNHLIISGSNALPQDVTLENLNDLDAARIAKVFGQQIEENAIIPLSIIENDIMNGNCILR